ncbi:50S ribosomal protein L15 [Candidatus Bilamarchaeum dharawalense]|uniref:Large ribosomal subunit protein uL15 n=1 Tax=Candidatus Bilamarchaeum dharawalense TaxID=2885759 RepID=A0A5E4LNS2_9ARCH|nr:50S ribosomal protein L15 [Candidatus Bilamarchaeum dharawalense]
MSRRQKGQKSGYLGHRTHGRGNVKNRRGSGNRGGRGMGGACKHKNSWIVKNAPGYFGKTGFVNVTRKGVDTVNLYEINQKALLNKLEKKDGKYHFDFKGKVLATGDVTVPLSIKALCWSKNVEKKLSEAGGQIVKIEAKAKAA